jgi:plastocyanin
MKFIVDTTLLTCFLLIGFSGQAFSQEAAVSINMTGDLTYDPDEITIQAGQTVLWENASKLIHTVTFDPSKALDKSHVALPEGVVPFGSDRIRPGKSYKHTFDVPGEYKYFCIPHEESGMTGKITVEHKGGSDSQRE